MVLPGWNVTEPLQVAGKFYIFVRAYRDADQQIKDFASSVNDFCASLKALDECLKNPDATPLDDNDHLKVASNGCQKCAESCQKFVKNFFNVNQLDPNQPDAPAGDDDMIRQINYINLHLNIAERKDRQRKGSTTAMPSAALAAEPQPLTPQDLFSRRDQSNTPEVIIREPQTPTDPEPRRDSGVSLGTSSSAIMQNLSGVTIYRKTPLQMTSQVKRLEFLRDSSGSLRCIIATLPANYSVTKFFHQVPPSSQVIPHTEHPVAYNDRRILLIKFLEPHLLTSERWSTSSNTSRSPSLGSSSIRSVSTASSRGTPETLPSNRSISESISIGSPLLLPNTPTMKEETKYPWYEFEDVRDYKTFQEHVFGKELLVNVPVNKIISKYIDSSRVHPQCETQYLRLWKSTAQTIMYYANGLDKPRYLEHDTRYFRINENKSNLTVLCMEIQSTVLPPSSNKRKVSIQSIFRRGSSKSIEADPNLPNSVTPGDLDNLSCLTITFTDAKGKSDFLSQAVFDVT